MSRLRIVIDTNVLISAALKPAGLEGQIIGLVAYGAVDLVVSREVLAEYEGVLNRPKFAVIPSNHKTQLLTLLGKAATMVLPTERLHISDDDDDNRFYECAAAGQAQYIITGNAKHFPKGHGAEIVTAREFIKIVAASASDTAPPEG